MIDRGHEKLTVQRQCKLLGVNRSTFYYQPEEAPPPTIDFTRIVDEVFMKHPFMGSRQITRTLRGMGYSVNRKRIQRMMRCMGYMAIAPGPHTSTKHPSHPIYPYLLRDLNVEHSNHVWCADITYIPMARGFQYLVAIQDWYSRKILSWRISNTMDSDFCVAALKEAISRFGCPEIFNTDQGSQFTSESWVSVLKEHDIAISMDGRRRALDNVFIERFWRTVKYEYIYLHPAEDGSEFKLGLREYIQWYNEERRHSSLADKTPDVFYEEGKPIPEAA